MSLMGYIPNTCILISIYTCIYIRAHSVMRRAQGCKEAGCRLRQEQRSSHHTSSNTHSHENGLYPNPLGVNESEVFLHTIGVCESPWLFRRPLPCSVPWHIELPAKPLDDFLRSNKTTSINVCLYLNIYVHTRTWKNISYFLVNIICIYTHMYMYMNV